jgi:hypothetical protein
MHHHAHVPSGVMMVKVADSTEASCQLSQLVVLGCLAIGFLHQMKDSLDPLRVRGIGGRRCRVQLASHGLPVVRRTPGRLLVPGTLPIYTLEDPIRIGPKAHRLSPMSSLS